MISKQNVPSVFLRASFIASKNEEDPGADTWKGWRCRVSVSLIHDRYFFTLRVEYSRSNLLSPRVLVHPMNCFGLHVPFK